MQGLFSQTRRTFGTSLAGDEVPTIGIDMNTANAQYEAFVGANASSGGLV